MVMNLRHTTCYMWLWYGYSRNPPNEILGPVSLFWIQIFFSVSQAFIVISQLCKAAGHQLHTVLYLPTTILLVAPIFCLRYTCHHHPGVVWLAHNVSPSAHICHTTSTLSRLLPTILLPNSSLRSTCRLFYIECCSIKYIYTRTFVSRTVPVSVYTAVDEQIEQSTAFRYHSCLG